MPAFVLGNGSDLVVADAGIRGLVIRNRAKDASIVDGQLVAEAGSPMAMLVKRCTAEALTGPGVRHQHPRHAGRRGVGQRRAPTTARCAT